MAVLTATNIYPTPCLGHIYTKEAPTVDLKIKSDWASCILSGKFTLRKQTHSLPLNLDVSWRHLAPYDLESEPEQV